MKTILEIKNYALENSIPILKDESLEFILKFILKNRIKKILEVGSATGYSAISFAIPCGGIHITSLEKDKNFFLIAKQNVLEMNLQNQIELLNIDAREFRTEKKFDLIFIDAAKGQYKIFFEKFKFNLSQNGVIICDNLEFHGMTKNFYIIKNANTKKLLRKIKKFISFLKSNPEFDTDFFSCGDGISVSKMSEKNFFNRLKFVQQKRKSCENFFDIFDEEKKVGRIEFIKLKNSILLKTFDIKKIYEKCAMKFLVEKSQFFSIHKILLCKDLQNQKNQFFQNLGFNIFGEFLV